MLDMVWESSPPWDVIIIIASFTLMGAFVFWNYLGIYNRKYFPGKALEVTLIKTVAWLVLYGGSFAFVFWLVSLALSPGWLRYVVGGGVWWLLSQLIQALVWELLDRLLDNLFG